MFGPTSGMLHKSDNLLSLWLLTQKKWSILTSDGIGNQFCFHILLPSRAAASTMNLQIFTTNHIAWITSSNCPAAAYQSTMTHKMTSFCYPGSWKPLPIVKTKTVSLNGIKISNLKDNFHVCWIICPVFMMCAIAFKCMPVCILFFYLRCSDWPQAYSFPAFLPSNRLLLMSSFG